MYGAALGGNTVELTLADGPEVIHQEKMPASRLAKHPVQWNDLSVAWRMRSKPS